MKRVRPVKDWACGKIHVTVVVPLDEIAAVFAVLQARSAVGRYVVPQNIFAWTVVLAADLHPFPIRRHRRCRRALVNFLQEVRAAVTNVVTVACSVVALT